MSKITYNNVDELPDLSQEPVHHVDTKTQKVTTYNSVDDLPDLKKKDDGGTPPIKLPGNGQPLPKDKTPSFTHRPGFEDHKPEGKFITAVKPSEPVNQQELAKSLIQHKAKVYTDANIFINQDLDNTIPKGISGIEPQKIKEKIFVGDDKVNISSYLNERRKTLNKESESLQNNIDAIYGSHEDYSNFTDEEKQKVAKYENDLWNTNQYKEQLEISAKALYVPQVLKNTPPPKDASPEAQKNYLRDIGVKVRSINDPIGSENKEKNVKDGLDKLRNQEIVQVEDYRAASEGLNSIQHDLDTKLGLGQISEDDYKEQSNQVKANYEKLFDYYPEAKKVAEYQVLGQILESERSKRISKTNIRGTGDLTPLWENLIHYGYSDKEVENAAKKLGKTDTEIKDLINKKDDIPGTSFIGNIFNQFVAHGAQNVVNPLSSLVSKGRLRTGEEVEAQRYERDKQFQLSESQLFDAPENITDIHPTIKDEDKNSPTFGKQIKNTNYLQQVNNPNAGNHNWGYGALNKVGDAVSGLANFLLVAETTGGLGDIALGGTIGADVSAVTKLNSLVKVAKFSQAQRNLFGNFVGLTLTSYNEHKEAAKQFIGQEQGGESARKIYAITMGMATGAVFGLGISPASLVGKAIGMETEQSAKSFADMIPKGGIESLDKSKWKEFFTKTIKNNILASAVKENVKATAIMGVPQAVDFAMQSMFNPQSVKNRNLGHELLNEGVKNFLTFAPISLFGAAVGSLKNPHADQSKLEQEAIYRMGQDPTQYSEYVSDQAKQGKIHQSDANKRIQMVNTMGSIIKSGIVPKELSRSEKIEYANNLLHAYYLDEAISNPKLPKEQVELKEKQIKDLQERRKHIIETSTGIEKDEEDKPIIDTKLTKQIPGIDEQGVPVIKKSDEEIKDLITDARKGLGVMGEHMEDDAILKMAAQQAQNVTDTGERPVTFNENAYEDAINQFGGNKELIDQATLKYPEESLLKKGEVTYPARNDDFAEKYFTPEEKARYDELEKQGDAKAISEMIAAKKAEIQNPSPEPIKEEVPKKNPAENLPDELKGESKPELVQRGANPIGVGIGTEGRWNFDRGAAPGEAFGFLDMKGDNHETAKGFLVEKETKDGSGTYIEAWDNKENLIGIYGDENKAAKALEFLADKELPEQKTTVSEPEKIISENTWHRGINKNNEGKGDKFFSTDESVAHDYAIDKVGDEPKMVKLSKEEHPENPLVVGSKEDLANTIGFPEEDIYDLKGEFDKKAKEYAQSKGHDAIVYESGSFDNPELHIFEKSEPLPKTKADVTVSEEGNVEAQTKHSEEIKQLETERDAKIAEAKKPTKEQLDLDYIDNDVAKAHVIEAGGKTKIRRNKNTGEQIETTEDYTALDKQNEIRKKVGLLKKLIECL